MHPTQHSSEQQGVAQHSTAQHSGRTSIMSLASTVKERDSSATFRLGNRLKMSCGGVG